MRERQFRPFGVERLADGPADAPIVGHAHHQSDFAGEHGHHRQKYQAGAYRSTGTSIVRSGGAVPRPISATRRRIEASKYPPRTSRKHRRASLPGSRSSLCAAAPRDRLALAYHAAAMFASKVVHPTYLSVAEIIRRRGKEDNGRITVLPPARGRGSTGFGAQRGPSTSAADPFAGRRRLGRGLTSRSPSPASSFRKSSQIKARSELKRFVCSIRCCRTSATIGSFMFLLPGVRRGIRFRGKRSLHSPRSGGSSCG